MERHFRVGKEEWIGFVSHYAFAFVVLACFIFVGIEILGPSHEARVLAAGIFTIYGLLIGLGIARRKRYELSLHSHKISEKELFNSLSVSLKDITRVRCVIYASSESAGKDELKLRLADESIVKVGKWLGKHSLVEVGQILIGPDRKMDTGVWIERG